jgi:CheY-like chemotaxis protein
VSRSSRGLIQTTKEPLALAPLFEMAVETARPLIQLRHHALVVRVPDEPIGLLGDRVRLVQVIANLLGNAAKFTPPGGHVTLEAVREGSEVTISVRDDGVGIAPEALPRIFDLFVQEEPSLARTQGGLGIGLTLVRDLVALHGGRVEARSEGLGKGAEFAVVLPALADETVALGAPPPQPERASHGGGLQVLVVEDNPDAAESMMMLLEVFGHGVRVAPDGESALEMASGEAPDLMLVDVGLPGIDGYEVARRVREAPALRETTLIALTGFGRDEDRDRARAAGFDHHLLKPVDPDALRRMMARIAEGLRRAP